MKTILILASLLALSFCNNENTKPTSISQTQSTISADPIVLTVYKDPNCGCCEEWAEHLENNDFKAETVNADDLDTIKLSQKIPGKYQSCHTGISKEGYFFEGHVPAKFIKQFLQEKPKNALGLTVPSMPVGTPGMEMGSKFMPYKIFMLMDNKEVVVYADIKNYQQQF
jgi:hypothetical protein